MPAMSYESAAHTATYSSVTYHEECAVHPLPHTQLVASTHTLYSCDIKVYLFVQNIFYLENRMARH